MCSHWTQDEAEGVWTRVEACYTQSVYVGAKPSDDVTTAPSTLYVLRRHVASAKSAYPYSASYTTTIPAAASVSFTLIDNSNLPVYKAKVADAIVAAKRKAKMMQHGLPESNEDEDDGTASMSTRSVSSIASSVVLRTAAFEMKGGDSVITRQPGPSVSEIIASNDSEQAPLPFHTQVFAWGKGEHGVLGTGKVDTEPLPVPLLFGAELGLVRIKAVSCSWFHTVALTDVGMVYGWGSGIDGALGHGNTDSLLSPRLIEYFGLSNPLFVTQISAGSDIVGAHTAAIAQSPDGSKKLYTWGLGTALGTGSSRSQWLPQPIQDATLNNAQEVGAISKVSCGGGFTAVITSSGAVFTWGKWTNGRLGLGEPPRAPEEPMVGGRRGVSAQKQGNAYCLHPRRVEALEGVKIVDVACGEAHAVAIDDDGQVYAWGKGDCGQLGTGNTNDALWPMK
jgi:Regulator of chromosome condensation (RCC1) repeat